MPAAKIASSEPLLSPGCRLSPVAALVPFTAQGPAVEEDLGSPLVAAQVGLPRTSGEVLEWGQVLKGHRLYPTVLIGSG